MQLTQMDIPMPSMSPSRDLADDPRYKRALLVRWVWRVLTQRFTTAGRWYALASGAFISYSGASLQLQGYVPAAYIGGIWVIAFITMLLWRPRGLIAAIVTERVSVGEAAVARLTITSQGGLRGGDLVVVPHRLPLGITCEPDMGISLPDLKPGETADATIKLRCSKRGSFALPGFRLESGFPFGILRARRLFLEPRKLLVYPRFTPLSSLALPTGRRYQPGGVALASQIGESFEYLGNREYREGDNVRDIDWRATARLGPAATPIVREWVEEYMLRVAVVLDTQIPKMPNKRERKALDTDFENAVSVAASVADYMARSDYLVDLFAAGPDLYHLTAGRSLAYLDQILDILTCVESSEQSGFARIEPGLSELIDRLSTVILVLLDFDEPRRQFAQSLAARGVAVKIIVVRTGKPTLSPLTDISFGEISVITAGDAANGVSTL